MGKSWSSKNRRDERDFLASLRKGKTVYVISEPKHAGQAHLWNHARTWSSFTVTGRHPILGGWVFNDDPSNGAKGFLGWHGEVYEDQPRGIPHHSDPGPRVAGPLRDGTYEMTMKEMQYLADQAEDRANADLKAGRRKRTAWF